MKRNWKVLIAACVGSMILSGSVLAVSPGVRIFINNVEFASSAFKLNVDKGTTMVSLRSIVEQFRGKLTYKDNSIYVTMPESSNVSMQVNSLENALSAGSAEEAVQTWIKGVQKRSGAMQYAVLSPTLRQNTKQEFEDNFWVTGGSSPHMGEVEATQLHSKQLTPDKVEFSFDYPLVVMTETIGTGSASITVDKIKRESVDYWAISDISLRDSGDTGIMIGATAASITYQNTTYNFTLTLPKSWEGKYEVRDRVSDRAGHNLDFINKVTKTGTLFTISVWSKEFWQANEADISGMIPAEKVGEKGNNVYIYHPPTDVQYDSSDEKAMEDYLTMSKDVKTIKASFKIIK
ncbi:hypothetical protein J2T13_002395 [Paenibacillus sp. DS2015]|uniref:hypothetical protein n=1 Tax=Paenibacillus sp. DS2015 TaxID=3373917 RepID=UPI003D192400